MEITIQFKPSLPSTLLGTTQTLVRQIDEKWSHIDIIAYECENLVKRYWQGVKAPEYIEDRYGNEVKNDYYIDGDLNLQASCEIDSQLYKIEFPEKITHIKKEQMLGMSDPPFYESSEFSIKRIDRSPTLVSTQYFTHAAGRKQTSPPPCKV